MGKKNKTMVNDPIGDMLIQIKNASLAGRVMVELPYSKMKESVAQILKKEGYVSSVSRVGQAPKYMMHITISYQDKQPVVSDVKRRSKPGLRVYVPANKIPKVVGGLGIAIISTSSGVMTGTDAKKRGLGGELLCEVW